MPKTCDVCDKTPARFNSIFDINLCNECKEDPAYKLIYKSTAKTKYYLTEKDIVELECFESVGTSNYSRGCKVTLIREVEVINYFCGKHGIDIDQVDDKIEELDIAKAERQAKREKAKYKKERDRKRELKKALKKAGCELRADSKLCQGYINGKITDWTVKKIVNRMCQMKYLFEYANMDHYLVNYAFEEAEMYALKKIGGYPDEWPWLE